VKDITDILGFPLAIGDNVAFEAGGEVCLGKIIEFTHQSIRIQADYNQFKFKRLVSKRLADRKIYKL